MLILMLTMRLCAACLAQPAQIILIRHAEKPDDPEDIHLTLKGRERAMALVPYLTETPELLTNGLPVALFATAAIKSSHSLRPQETVEPLSKRLKLPIHSSFLNKEYAALARHILTNPEYRGKTVVICWVHDYIPELVEALGVRQAARKKWKSGSFDRTYLIIYRNNATTLLDMPQKLLFGDSSR